MWDGANAAQCFIVVDSQAQYKNLTQNHGPLTRALNLNSIDEARGIALPLAWDNQTIYTLLKDSLSEIVTLESKIKDSVPDDKDAEIAQLRKTVQELTNFIEQVNGIFNTFLPKDGK